MTELKFDYDKHNDVLTIEGMKYAGELFRAWADGGLSLGTRLRLIARKDGCITLECV